MMLSSLTLGIRALAAIPRASNITAKTNMKTAGYNNQTVEREI